MSHRGAILVLAMLAAFGVQCLSACASTALAAPVSSHCHQKSTPPSACSHPVFLVDKPSDVAKPAPADGLVAEHVLSETHDVLPMLYPDVTRTPSPPPEAAPAAPAVLRI